MLPTPHLKDVDYEKIYEPSEDSFYLLDCLEDQKSYLESKFKNHVPVVVEIGTGSGIITTFLLQCILQEALYMATDVNPSACTCVLKTASHNCPHRAHLVDSLQMSLASAVRPNTVDILVFNPPYVPAEEVPELSPDDTKDTQWLDLALLGGEDGMVTTWKVLNGLDSILSAGGVAYILFCARNHPESVAQQMQRRGWKVDVIIHKKAGWEVLSILRFLKA
ncbi:uncharacterized protein LODBEIA_P23040 [Lodderomyces beijingensis]|uniref:Methyltransferase small domain-containing protein n=1 Tax=Lodderomyces beijingensis TaxID=1775926 RepID=A0ABP0ZIW2_9ASCO